jgi:inorganic pyrophosphatase
MSLLSYSIGRGAPPVVNASVEIPRASSHHYGLDLQHQAFVLDRGLYSPLYYPRAYGWVAGPLSEDGDPLDIPIFGSQPTFPGCVVGARPVGGLRMRDEHGVDFKAPAP